MGSRKGVARPSESLGTVLGLCLQGILPASASVTLLCPWVYHRRYLTVSAEKFTLGGMKVAKSA